MNSVTNDENEKLKINMMAKECDSIGQAVRNFILGEERIIALGLTIMGAALAYGLKEKINEILLILPIAVFGVMIYGSRLFHELMSMAGYKKYLEEKINNKVGENILFWELFISKEMHGSFPNKVLYIIYVIFLALTVYISLGTASKYYSKNIFWGMVIVISFLTIGLIISFIKMNRAFEKIYTLSKRESEKKVPEIKNIFPKGNKSSK